MEIRPLAKNAFVVALRSGVRILYSYGAPVAVFDPRPSSAGAWRDKRAPGYLRSEWYVSNTTSAHVAEFSRGNTTRAVPHDEILKIAQEA